MKLQNSTVKRAFEPMTFTHLPFSVYDLKCNILVRCSCFKSYDQRIFVFIALLQIKLRRFSFVEQLWIKNVELIPLDNLRRRIISIIMNLIVLVPLKPLLHTVVVTRFSRHIAELLIVHDNWLLHFCTIDYVCEFNFI